MGIFNRMLHHLRKTNSDTISKQHHDRLMSQVEQQTALMHLQEDRQTIEILTNNRTEGFQTIILGIDLYHHHLLLDEPVPQVKRIEDFVGQTITVRHQHQQLMLCFSTVVLDYNPVDRTLIVDLPHQTEYQPRRLQPRLEFGEKTAYSASVYPLYGSPWAASLKNISTGGMRIAVPEDLRSTLHKNLPIQRCEFNLDFNSSIRCRGRIKSFSFSNRPYRHTLISLMFENLSEKDRSLLEDFMDNVLVAA